MNGLKMLDITGMGGGHIPWAIGIETEELSASIVFSFFVEEERQRKEGLGTIEKKQVPVPFNDGVGILSGEPRDFCRPRDMRAATIGAILPNMKRALQRFTNDMTAAEVGAEVGTACIDHRKFTACSAKGDEVAPKDALTEGPGPELVDVTKWVPRSGVLGEG